MLHLTQDSAPAVIEDVDAAMQGVPVDRFPNADADTAEALVAHARLLRNLLPATDQGLKTLFALPSHDQQERIRGMVIARGAICERKAARYRYALYAVSLVLAGALILLGLRLERRARHMRRRADIEHVIAGISTRFINARSEFVPIHIERALEELSHCLGADRAYFIAGGDAPRSYLWRRPGVHFPTDWPLGTLAAASAVRDRPTGMIRIRRGDRSPLNQVARMAGTSDSFCISATGDEAGRGSAGIRIVGRRAQAHRRRFRTLADGLRFDRPCDRTRDAGGGAADPRSEAAAGAADGDDRHAGQRHRAQLQTISWVPSSATPRWP